MVSSCGLIPYLEKPSHGKDKGKRKSMRAKDFTHIARGSSGVKSAREMGKSHS